MPNDHARPLGVQESERKRQDEDEDDRLIPERCKHGTWGGCDACNPDAAPECDKDMHQ